MTGQFECNDIMGILEHLADNDLSSLQYIDKLEKTIFLESRKLRRDDISSLLISRVFLDWRRSNPRIHKYLSEKQDFDIAS